MQVIGTLANRLVISVRQTALCSQQLLIGNDLIANSVGYMETALKSQGLPHFTR